MRWRLIITMRYVLSIYCLVGLAVTVRAATREHPPAPMLNGSHDVAGAVAAALRGLELRLDTLNENVTKASVFGLTRAELIMAVLTAVLVGVTILYVRATYGLLRATEKQLAQTQDQLRTLESQRQLVEKNRNAEVFISMLARYIEKPELTATRRWVDRNMEKVNEIWRTLPDLPRKNTSRAIIDQKIKDVSGGAYDLEAVYTHASAMQNICVLIHHGFIEQTLVEELFEIIQRHWQLLGPLVRFERETRDAEGRTSDWYCDDFQVVAEMITERDWLEKHGIEADPQYPGRYRRKYLIRR